MHAYRSPGGGLIEPTPAAPTLRPYLPLPTLTMRSPLLLFALLLPLSIALIGCNTDEDDLPVLERDIPFQSEGTLDFYRPDSSRIVTIDIEIAETEEEQQRGLMERRSLPSRSGMLFVYDEPDTLSFWMRNTPLSLDIIFVGEDDHVVDIARRTTPYSDELIRPDDLAQYAVEVRAGFADRHEIDEEVWVDWRRN